VPKLFTEISEKAESDFRFLKGVLGCKTNGEAMEKIIADATERKRAELKKG